MTGFTANVLKQGNSGAVIVTMGNYPLKKQ
jgi:hypothetical protein